MSRNIPGYTIDAVLLVKGVPRPLELYASDVLMLLKMQ